MTPFTTLFITRRRFLAMAAGTAGLAALRPANVLSGLVERNIRELELRLGPATAPLLGTGYPEVAVWAYNGRVPGPEIRVRLLPEPDLDKAEHHEIRFQGGMMGGLREATLDGRPVGMMQMLRAGKAWAVNGIVATGHVHDPILTLRRGRSYRLTLVNDTAWPHPMHLHGHSFRVLKRNGRPTVYKEWQDTVLMAPNETAEIALMADNPGDWMFHCHILEHQDGGMMAVVRVA